MSESIDTPESKSARKREARRLRELGVQLATLGADQLELIPLDDELRRVLIEHARITSHIARKRHAQLIGRLMRRADVATIEAAIDGIERKSAESRYAHHSLERWRSELIADDEALTRFVTEYPGTDVQQLRMQVRRTRSHGDDPAHARALFRMLREIVADHPVPPTVI